MQERLGQQGCYDLVHDFPAVNNASTTYTVTVSFNETDAVSASATSITLGGSNYAMCTTIQCSYKPCGNSTVLTVDPQSTIATISTKTAEEMQQEAEGSGGLTIWHEFSWSYPWYRLHVQASVNPTIHVAFNPILPGGEIADWDGMVFFSNLGEEVVQTAAIETLGLVSTYILAKCTSLTSFWGGIIVEGLKNRYSRRIITFVWLEQRSSNACLFADEFGDVAVCLD